MLCSIECMRADSGKAHSVVWQMERVGVRGGNRIRRHTLKSHLLSSVDNVEGDGTSDQEGGHGADEGNGPGAHFDVDLDGEWR